jgi:hypothetical protein
VAGSGECSDVPPSSGTMELVISTKKGGVQGIALGGTQG